MLIERMIFNILAFLLFILMFFKMVKKNDSNYIAFLVIQALGIAISFLELMVGKVEWTIWKAFSYLISVVLPIVFFYYDSKNVNIIESFYIAIIKMTLLMNKQSKAKKQLLNLIDKYPESYLGHKLLAEIYEKEGGMRKAIGEYVKAIDIHKEDYESYYKIAELLNNFEQKDEAINMLNNLIKIKPDYKEASELLGTLLIEEERFKEAINVYMEALRYRPNDYELYYNLGIAYTRVNDFKSAKMAYEKAATINHLTYKASYSLGQISLIYNDIEAAEKYFTQALYGEEVEAMAYFELSKIYMLKKDKEKAILFLNKAIELDEVYVKKLDEELIFIPIRAYIETKPNGDKKVVEKHLSSIEQKAKEHLENTYNVVEKLSDKDKIETKIDFSKEFKGKQR